MDARNPLSMAAALALVALMFSTHSRTHAAPPAPFHAYAREIGFVDLGAALAVEAELLGLDRRFDVLVELRAQATVELACINPAGKEVPTQTPAPLRVELEGKQVVPGRDIRFGWLDVEIYTDELGAAIPGAPDCPNRNWTERVEQVRFLAAHLEVRQAGRRAVELLCEFTRPTSDGRVPDSRFRCFAL